ncbi:DUF6745 domain-containing protein [Azospirillum canadense]|uniref:DUF6745 domain-containing protein n=1 Tax=Azospirillum canadense TaxID=403962 RepID=UPI00222742A6|nr:hypothetical protein [Azospirillum canadense]MCW2239101.1 hypothetical protein [Azospirillum canadense]
MDEPGHAVLAGRMREPQVGSGHRDRKQAEWSVRDLYIAAGLAPPRSIVWLAGPREAQRALEWISWRRWLLWMAMVLGLVIGLIGWCKPLAIDLASGGISATPWIGSTMVLALASLIGGLPGHGQRSVRGVIAGLSAHSALLLAAAAIVPAAVYYGGSLSLIGGVLSALAVAGLFGCPLGGATRFPCRFGRLVAPRIDRLLIRALPAQSSFPVETLKHHLMLRPALAHVLRQVTPAPECPIRALFDHCRSPGAADRPSSAIGDAALALLRHADVLWAYRHVALVLARPVEAHGNERGLLHNGAGAAVRWADGSVLLAVDGEVGGAIDLDLARLSIDDLQQGLSAALRRVLIECFGPERLMRALGGHKLAADPVGELWRAWDFDGEPLVMVRVLNSTPEPDGRRRAYWLRVPPATTTPRAGVAWTFGLDADAYQPVREA